VGGALTIDEAPDGGVEVRLEVPAVDASVERAGAP
jgi:hypothetical protein